MYVCTIYTNNHIHTYVSVHWTYIIPIIPFLFNAFKHMLASGTKGLLRLKHQMNFVLGQGPILSVCSNHSGKLPWDCCANAKTLMAQQLLKIWVQLWVRKTIDTTLCHHLQMIRHHALAAFFFLTWWFESLETSKCYWYDARVQEMYDFRTLGQKKHSELAQKSSSIRNFILSLFLSLWTGTGKYICIYMYTAHIITVLHMSIHLL